MTNPGIDSQGEIIGIVSLMEMDKYLRSYFLGHGRGSGEKELIQEGSEKRFEFSFKILISLSYVSRLEFLTDYLDPRNIHVRFRICIVTISDDRFPVGVITTERNLLKKFQKGSGRICFVFIMV
jgi:hypothetical protein